MKIDYKMILCYLCFFCIMTSTRSLLFSPRPLARTPPVYNQKQESEMHRNKKSINNVKLEQEKSSTLTRLKSVSLDTAILPTHGLRVSPLSFPPRFSLFILVSAVLSSLVVSPGEKLMKNTKGIFLGKLWPITDVLVPGITLLVRILFAKVGLLIESAVKKVTSIGVAEEKDFVGGDDWSICTVSERESISSKYVKYRFELDNPSSYVPLDIGQEITLCTVDSENRVFKEPFFPVSSLDAQGYFDIIARRDRESSSSADKFTKALDTLALQDEIAFKTGRNKLNYIGNDDTITQISIVASSMGIVPVIQIIRGILSDPESSVESVDLLWINEDKGDFFCNREIEKLEYRYFERLAINRVLETDLYGRDLSKVSEVMDQFSDYEPGKVAIVSGPDFLISKARNLYYEMEYPTVNIMSINCA